MCEAPEGVAIKRGGAGLRFQPLARVNCAFAQRLERFETIMQEEARSIFKSPVTSIVHLGTYNCRRMAAYPDWVSEHSFANAIDIATFVLKNGRRVEVERDWVRAEKPADDGRGAVPAPPDPPPLRREGVLGRAHAVIRQPPQEPPPPRRRRLHRRRHLSARTPLPQNNDRGPCVVSASPPRVTSSAVSVPSISRAPYCLESGFLAFRSLPFTHHRRGRRSAPSTIVGHSVQLRSRPNVKDPRSAGAPESRAPARARSPRSAARG